MTHNETTVLTLWRECRGALEAAGIENAAAEADWLWQAAVQTDRHLLRPTDAVEAAGAAALRELTARRTAHEPIQYLLGSWPFLDFEVKVAPGVLIPRQDTECVAQQAIALGKELLRAGIGTEDAVQTEEKTADAAAFAGGCSGEQPEAQPMKEAAPQPRWLDLCSGSGILALALAVHLRVPVTAVELSEAALPLLRENTAAVCKQFGAPPVRVAAADVFSYVDTLADDSVALIVSNPPYLTAQEMTQLQPEVTREPAMALDGGMDGLRFYRLLAQSYRRKLMPGGALVLEIGALQGEAVCGLLRESGWQGIRLHRDAPGLDRCITARR